MKYTKCCLLVLIGAISLAACSKEYSLENNGVLLPVGNWQFQDSSKQYAGNIDSAYIIETSGFNKELHLIGTSLSGEQVFALTLYGSAIDTGVYNAPSFQSAMEFTTSGELTYQVNQFSGDFKVTITSITNGVVTGIFSGKAIDSLGNVKSIFEGRFQATLNSQGTPSVGVLGDSSGYCLPVITKGDYITGIAVTAENTAEVQVVVTSAGSYHIFTNEVAGVTFSGTGSFTNAGVHQVILTATGTPLFSGTHSFTLHYGDSQCAFGINVVDASDPSINYYPLTENCDWSFEKIQGSGVDSFMYKVLSGSKVVGSQSYAPIGQYALPPQFIDTALYLRKENGNYFSYMNLADIFSFDQPVWAEILILKDNVPARSTWQSPTFTTGTVDGTPVPVHFIFTILEKSVQETLGSFIFPDVIKVKMDIYAGAVKLGQQELWYAKNVGLVYINDGTNIYQISDYHIF